MEKEIWRAIKGYEGLYEVSNFGRVRSLDRYVTHNKGGLRCMKGKVFKPHIDTNYYFACLTKIDHSKSNKHYHLLVAQAFPEICGEWFDGAVVHHKDLNQYNNRADNLQVLSEQEHRAIHNESDETFKRRSDGIKRFLAEKGHPMKGKHHSDATKQKMSQDRKKFTDAELKQHRKEYVERNRERYLAYQHYYDANVRNRKKSN